MPSAGKHSLNLHSLNFHSVNVSFPRSAQTTELSRGSVQILIKDTVVKATSKFALALVASFALGAAAVQTLYAQAKPPGYAIVEVNVTDENDSPRNFFP